MYRNYSSDDLYDDDEDSLAEDARDLVMDYYGTAMYGGVPAAGGDLISVQRMGDSEIIAEARRLGLI